MSCKASWELKFVLELVFKCLVLSKQLSKYKKKMFGLAFLGERKQKMFTFVRWNCSFFLVLLHGVFSHFTPGVLSSHVLPPYSTITASTFVILFCRLLYLYIFVGLVAQNKTFSAFFLLFLVTENANNRQSRLFRCIFRDRNVQKHWCSPWKARTFLSAAWVKRPKGNVCVCFLLFNRAAEWKSAHTWSVETRRSETHSLLSVCVCVLIKQEVCVCVCCIVSREKCVFVL